MISRGVARVWKDVLLLLLPRPLLTRFAPLLRRSADVFALGGFLVLALIWLRPLPWKMATHLTAPVGDPALTAWRLVWPIEWLMRHPAPFLDATIAYPTTDVFVRDEITLGGSALAAPFYLLTHNPVLAYNATLLVAFVITGYATYLLATSWAGLRSAAFLAGCVVAFAPCRMAQVGHLGLISFGWTPLVLLGIDRLLATGKAHWAVLVAVGGSMQVLSAGYYAYVLALAITLYLAAIFAFRRPLPPRRTLWLLGSGLLGGLLLALPFLAPFARVAEQEHFQRPLQEVAFWSARPQSYLAATPDNLIYGRLVRRAIWKNWTSEAYLFPGVVPLALACLGVIGGGARRRWLAVAFAAAAFVLSLGPALHLAQRDPGRFPLPYRAAYAVVPGVSSLRAPLRIAPLLMLGIALLAAYGVRWLRDRTTRYGRYGHAISRLLAPVLIASVLAEFLTAPLATVRVRDDAHPSPVGSWLESQPPAVVCELPDPTRFDSVLRAAKGHNQYVNGTIEIRPRAERELFRLLGRFGRNPADTAEALRVLQALGVTYLVLHRADLTPGEWADTKGVLQESADDVAFRATEGDADIYQLRPARERYGDLLAAVPEGSHIFVSDWTGGGSGVLNKAILMRLLAGRTIATTLRTEWTPPPTPPDPRASPEFGMFYRTENVPSGWDMDNPVWANRSIIVYRAQK